MWPDPVVLVAEEELQQRLLLTEIPQLQQWLQSSKPILRGDRWPDPSFQGLLLTTPEAWLSDRISAHGHFSTGIPTILDGADHLEAWTRNILTAGLRPADWNDLRLAFPRSTEMIRDLQAHLAHSILQHPPNPYCCHLIDEHEQVLLQQLYVHLSEGKRSTPVAISNDLLAHCSDLPASWQKFWQIWQHYPSLSWATVSRASGHFSLFTAPADVTPILTPIWPQQPMILAGSVLDLEADAPTYRQQIGITDLTCLKFLPDRHNEVLQLYLPEQLPLPNTPQFQAALNQEVRMLLIQRSPTEGIAVLIVGDVPLRAQIGTLLASELGSRVQVERTSLDKNGILVTGWEFWKAHAHLFPTPQLLGIATLPIPSLENPVVAGRVAYYKQQRQDWFRLYLLPTAIHELQRAIAPVRERQGLVALFDSRVIHRSYGQQILAALSPVARTNYLELENDLLSSVRSSMLD
jgi:ATP-dependent DNA helicase DinG